MGNFIIGDLMDLFKKNNSDIAMAYDIYDKYVSYKPRTKAKDKKMLRKLSRSRLKQEINKEYIEGEDSYE